MPNLARFTVDELAASTELVHDAAAGSKSMEQAAQALTAAIYDRFVDDDGQRACVLVRLYKTHRLDGLDSTQKAAARDAAGADLDGDVRCLTLVGSAGVEPEWNDRRTSSGHRAIPLLSAVAVDRLPMVAGLIEQLGLEVSDLVDPDPGATIALHHRHYNVFHVEEAKGSRLVPAQDFVEGYGVRSVVGFGGVLPSGDMFALILFSRVVIPAAAADLLRALAMSIKAAVVPFTFKVFDDEPAPAG